MTNEQRTAYEWAKKQNFPSVAGQYAKLLAEAVDELEAELAKYRELGTPEELDEALYITSL